MPRNGSGSYSPPSNTWNPATPETAILSDDWNTTLADMATALTQSIASDGQTTTSALIPFSQGISVSDGLLSAPAISVIGDSDTGIYFPAANQLALVAGGIAIMTATSTTVTFPVGVVFSGSPSISGNLTLTGNLTVNGNSNIGDSSGDTLTVAATGTFAGNQTFNGTATFTSTVTVPDASFANAKLADMATATIKGRVTAGTGVPEDLTATQATTILNPVVGDSGSGGTKGLAPAPAAGDAADRKMLQADGTWAKQSVFAFALLNGATGALIKGFNVASATRLALGVYEITFTDAAADANYTTVATARVANATGFATADVSETIPPTTADVTIRTAILTVAPAIAAGDVDYLYVAVYQ